MANLAPSNLPLAHPAVVEGLCWDSCNYHAPVSLGSIPLLTKALAARSTGYHCLVIVLNRVTSGAFDGRNLVDLQGLWTKPLDPLI